MDTPTRVGLGGTALFTLAGVGVPILTWWVSGPLMAVCAFVAMWGFWPLLRHAAPLSLRMFSRYIPLETAAQIAYETIEKTGLDDITRTKFSDPDVALRSYRFMLLYTFDDTKLIGVRPPSNLSLPIPRNELKSLNPTKTSTLEPLNDKAGPGYCDVRISRRDMHDSIHEHLALLRRNEARRVSHA